MTANQPADGWESWESLPTKTCRACGREGPVGAFCGSCGATFSPRRGDGPAWLRLRSHAAAPDENALLPSITTSLFPRLPRRSRSAFRIGLVVLVVLLVALVLLRWQPPLIGISALGLPLLFAVYLLETDAFDDLPLGTLVVTAALGTGLGVGWAITTDAIWARTYDDVLAAPMTNAQALINLVAVPVAGVVLALVPVAAIRLWRPGVRESLDGFVIGAIGALCFVSAGMLTRAAPEFANGLVVKEIPMDALFTLAAIRGVAVPLTAAAAGGAVGASLWFHRRPDPKTARSRFWLTSPALALTVALLAYVGQNGIDFAWISYLQIVGLYAAIAVLMLLFARIVVHCTLLSEVSHDTSPREPVLCPQCDHVVPDVAFCANCGVAANAASRSSRRARRTNRPVPTDVVPDGR